MKFLPQLILYIRAKRLYRTITFLHTLLGYIAVKGFVFSQKDVFPIAFAVIVFGVIFHGGIYAINNIADRKADARSRRKQNRILASSKIDYRWFTVDAVVSILIAFVLTWHVMPSVLVFMIVFLVMNIFYTFILKRWNILVGALFVSTTHALRVALGVFIAGGDIWQYWPLYVLVWMGLTGIITRKIQFERRKYPSSFLRVMRITTTLAVLLFGLVTLTQKAPVIVVLVYWIYYLGGHILYHFSPVGRRAFQRYWQQS